jgi:hypothetical protein
MVKSIILIIAIGLSVVLLYSAFTFSLTPPIEQTPIILLNVSNNPDTVGADLVIKHKGGDILKGGEYKLSVMPVGDSPKYQTSVPGSDYYAGDRILVNATTVVCLQFGGPCILTNSSLTTGTLDLMARQKYDVKLVHIPTDAMLIDTVIEVR